MTTQPLEEPEPGPIGPPHDATAFEDSVSTLTPGETKALNDTAVAAARVEYARDAASVRTQYNVLIDRQPHLLRDEPEVEPRGGAVGDTYDPTWTVDEVKAWVGTDVARAQIAFDAEEARTTPRVTLDNWLATLLAT